MTKFKLSSNNYALLKTVDLSELCNGIVFDDEEKTVCVEDKKQFFILLNEDIVARGMDEKQNECTEFGQKLYALYDELYYSDEQ